MDFKNKQADIFVPDGTELDKALSRTTHLCIGAHPDDIEINCYPAIAECFGKAESWFTGVTVTNGAGSARAGIYAEYSDTEMVAVRRSEQRKAAVIGEYNIQFQLGYSSSGMRKDPDVIDDLKQILDATQPDTIYLHNPADKHDTHVAVFLRSLEAIRALPLNKRPKKAFAYEGWRNLDWLCDSEKIALDASKFPNLAAALTGLFDSQISGGKRYDLAIAGRRRSNATFHDSHSVDNCDAVNWAVNLTALIENENLSVETFVLDFIERFRKDVLQRLRRLK